MKLDSILNLKGHEVATITPDKTVAEVVATLTKKCVGALVVSGDGSSVDGIVTERDIVRVLAASGASVLEEPVSAIMTASVQCAPPSAAVSDLMALMTERRFRHVPVIDEPFIKLRKLPPHVSEVDVEDLVQPSEVPNGIERPVRSHFRNGPLTELQSIARTRHPFDESL